MPKERLRFGGPSELTTEEADIIYDIVIDKEPIKVVEFPTFGGKATLYIAEALRDLNGGQVYSFDYVDRGIEPDAQEWINGHHVSDYVGLIKVDDLDDLIAKLKSTLRNTNLLFLDSLHVDIEKVWEAVEPSLSDNITLVFHDVECEPSEEMKTPAFFKKLASSVGFGDYRIYTTKDNAENKNSIGVIDYKKVVEEIVAETLIADEAVPVITKFEASKETKAVKKRRKKATKKVQKG